MHLQHTFSQITVLALLLCLPLSGFAQSKKDLSNYAYAKQLIEGGKYVQAHTVLEDIISEGAENQLYNNAAYLQGLTKYKQGKTQEAREQLFKLVQQYPNWKGAEEVHFLLATIDFEWEMPEQAFKNLAALKDQVLLKEAYYLKKKSLEAYGVAKLKQLRESQPNDEALERVLLAKLYKEGNWELEKPLIEELEAKYNPNSSPVEQEAFILKDKYLVGVFLPLQYKSINTSNPKASFVLDMYEGMEIAQKKLREEGVELELHVFDTENDSAATESILSDPELEKLDLILGPVYPPNIRVVSRFAQEHGIPVVNPLREEPWIAEATPQNFLFSTSIIGQAKFAAEYAFKELKSVQSYIVLGNKRRDIEMADAYKARMEEMGGQVLNYIQFSYDEDSYKNLIKQLKGIVSQSNAHVFVTSRDLTVANTLISALQALQSNATIIAPDRWMERPQLSFSRMESAHVRFYHPLKYDESTEEAVNFQKAYLDRANIYPSKYAYIGYGAMYYFGKALQQYGTGLAEGIQQPEAAEIEMPLFGTPSYQMGRDNAQMCISGFKDGKFQTLYPQQAP